MKQKISIGASISVLIGVVIAILALLRGPVKTVLLLITFAIWGIWVWLTLRPVRQDEQEEPRYRNQAEVDPGPFSSRNLLTLLTRHVNCRVSDCLKQTYPNVSWEWMMSNPASFIAHGGTGRIRVYNVPDYEYADITLDHTGKLECSMAKVVPVQSRAQGTPSGQPAINPQAWYELEGRRVLDDLIADLRSRGHSRLTLAEDGSIRIQAIPDGQEVTKGSCSNFPAKVYWPQLATVLKQDGLSADVLTDRIVVSW